MGHLYGLQYIIDTIDSIEDFLFSNTLDAFGVVVRFFALSTVLVSMLVGLLVIITSIYYLCTLASPLQALNEREKEIQERENELHVLGLQAQLIMTDLRARHGRSPTRPRMIPVAEDAIPTNDPELECLACKEHIRNYVATPCGHLALCSRCILNLQEQICPTCRAEVVNWQRVFD